MTLVRILAEEPVSGFVVRLRLANGEEVDRDLTHRLNGPIFDSIRTDEARFRQVQALERTLVWPGGADLRPDAVIWGGLPPKDSALRAAWFARRFPAG
ncbi:MAG: DUF2442 domain-containing protein [Acidobacteria bacterium]|nr:DUF2442 domain-containing protein [Acidobacteriota bacterium]